MSISNNLATHKLRIKRTVNDASDYPDFFFFEIETLQYICMLESITF